MDIVWRLGQATVSDVCRALSRPLAYTTVMTTLNVLEAKKGVLERTKQRPSFRLSADSDEEVSRNMINEMRDVLFAGSLPSLVLNLMSDESVSKEDIQALKAALQRVERDK